MDFARSTVIDDLSFDIREGETFGFLGANGPGKTTTIRALLGIYLSIRATEPHPIVRLSPTNRAEEHQWWCGSAPLALPATNHAVDWSVCSLML